ncbi:MAG: transglycosylase SLT domain-containing protein [Pseudomonadota bacterium]
MAITIPTQSLPGVQNRPLPAPQIQSVGPDTSGLKLQQTALGVVGDLANKEMERADTAAMLDAESKLSQAKLDLMFNKESGVYAKTGKDALDITNSTLPAFDKQAEMIGQGLTNPRQKEQFARIVNNNRQSLNGELNRYEFTQRNAYYDTVDKTNIATSLDGAVKYANDPAQVAYYQNKGSFIIGESGIRKGLPPETIAAQQQEFNSTVASNVIQRMVTLDPMQAQQYYAKEASTMTAADQLKAQKLLGTSVRQQMAGQMAANIWDKGSVGGAGLPALIMQAESGGNQAAVSPKGAIGAMQLMPETAKETSEELGIPFSPARLATDANYNVALGTAYLNKMLGRFGGNETLAVAAYNAGPGMVDDWVNGTNKTGKNPSKLQLPDPRTGEAAAQEFIQKIPFQETRNYTAGIMQQAAATVPASQKYADGLAAANAITDPQLKKFVMDDLDDRKKAATAQGNALYDQAAKIVLDEGFSKIPAQLMNNIPADELVKLQRMDDYRRKGTEPTTDYGKFQDMLKMPVEQLAALNLEKDVRPYTSNADFNTVRSAWQKAQNGDATVQKVAAGKENAIETTMARAGILIGKNAAALKPDNLKKQQQFRSAMQERQDSFRVKHDREPNIAETEDLANQLLLDVKLTGGGFLFGDSSQKLWEVTPENLANVYISQGTMKIEDVPPTDRREIINVLRASGQQASEANIIAAYQNRISGLGVKIK